MLGVGWVWADRFFFVLFIVAIVMMFWKGREE